MMKNRACSILSATLALLSLLSFATVSLAEDKIKLKTTVIKGNTELPKILYVVPWQDSKESQKSQQKLVLHSLFGDLFEPITPEPPSAEDKK